MNNLVYITQKLDVLETDTVSGKTEIYYSRVEEVGSTFLLIQPPFRKGFYLHPKVNRKITAKVISNQCPYTFEANLMEVIKTPLLLWKITAPANIQKAQMREYARIDVKVDVVIEDTDTGDLLATKTRDVSGGGLSATIPKAFPLKKAVTLKLLLPDKSSIEAKGEVVRVARDEDLNGNYVTGIKFTGIDENKRRQLIQFVFTVQIERRQKEKQLLL